MIVIIAIETTLLVGLLGSYFGLRDRAAYLEAEINTYKELLSFDEEYIKLLRMIEKEERKNV